MRVRSTVQKLLVYATFVSLSVALHMLVILGTRPLSTPADDTAAVDSSRAAPEEPTQ